MAKGQMRSNREKKKPKKTEAEKKKPGAAAPVFGKASPPAGKEYGKKG